MEPISIEDIFPEECALHGYKLVGTAYKICLDLSVPDLHTPGDIKEKTRGVLKYPENRRVFKTKLGTYPDSYDPWKMIVERRRSFRTKEQKINSVCAAYC